MKRKSATFKLSLDFRRSQETIKPLHGVNNCPVRFHDGKIPEFEAAGIPFVRTHDSGGPYGRSILIDIPNIFRDFNADPDDPASYDFAFTDVYLRNLVNSGCRIFYRLGISIENFHAIKAYRTAPPADFKKWAGICEGVIRHYNEGWANGFHYAIEYWEIWNEPENPPMWSGTMEQFFRLYTITAKHLKQRFPALKIGGYGSCGFYSVTRKNTSVFFQTFPRWFDAFLRHVRKENAPLDFFSWHLYTSDAAEISAHAKYVAEKLRDAGFSRTENIFGEWNFIDPTCRGNAVFVSMKEMPGALFTAEALCRLQDSPVDKAMYYDAEPTRTYCGLFYFPGESVTPTYHVFRMFSELYRLGGRIALSGKPPRNFFALAAADAGEGAVLLVNRAKRERILELETGRPLRDADATLLDRRHPHTARRRLSGRVLHLPQESVLLLRIPLSAEALSAPERKTDAGTQARPDRNFVGLAAPEIR